MAGGDAVGAKLHPSSLQGFEFQVTVAPRARIRRIAMLVRSNEVVDDVLGKRFLEVRYVEGDSQLAGHPSRVSDVVQGATGLAVPFCRIRAIPELHGDAYAVVALGVQQGGTYGTVNATAHCYEHSLAHRVPFAGVRKDSCVLP